MIDVLMQYALFLAQVVTLVAGIGVIIVMIATAVRRSKDEDRLEINNLNARYKQMELSLKHELLDKKLFRGEAKAARKAARKKTPAPDKRLFLVNFRGDIRASAVSSLREEISAILTVATAGDEVLVRLENAGGLVHDHGLAASQLARVRDKGIRLTVAVDKIAASGGYLMACIADRILAAPFAVLGSIGVLAQIPNFNRMLDSHGVDFEQFKAGEYKRTVTLFGKNTDADREKFSQEISDTHALFKEFVAQQRPSLDVDKVATGEHWYGKRALDLALCDELKTSDDYLLERSADTGIYEVKYTTRKPLARKLTAAINSGCLAAMESVRQHVYEGRYAA
ncbi:MAG TPA: protease SohB [Gammaproteobacteria bacterium]|jgi:serine protease SohB